MSFKAAWDVAELLHIKPESVYGEIRRYRKQERERFRSAFIGAEHELDGWLQTEAQLGHDLVHAHERLHSEAARNPTLAMLASMFIPFGVYLAYLRARRGDPDLAAMLTRTELLRPVHIRRVEPHNLNAEALFRRVMSPGGFAAWTAAVEQSPVRVRPGWGSPITVLFDREGFGRLKGDVGGGAIGQPPPVNVRILLAPRRVGTRVEMLVEEEASAGCDCPRRRRANLREWWVEVVLPELLHLADGFPPDASAPGVGRSLGLAIARILAARQDAALHVDDAVGGGAVFSVWLPRLIGGMSVRSA